MVFDQGEGSDILDAIVAGAEVVIICREVC
jgi:hypothetical protein